VLVYHAHALCSGFVPQQRCCAAVNCNSLAAAIGDLRHSQHQPDSLDALDMSQQWSVLHLEYTAFGWLVGQQHLQHKTVARAS
jgi:hypothetical protein